MNRFRHCERSEAIHDFRLHGLPRYARSDGNNTVIASNVVTRKSIYGGLAMTATFAMTLTLTTD